MDSISEMENAWEISPFPDRVRPASGENTRTRDGLHKETLGGM